MLVQMTTGLSGPALTLNPGDEHDFPQEEAIRFINAGYAVPVVKPDVERAVLTPAVEARDVVVPQTVIKGKNGKGRR